MKDASKETSTVCESHVFVGKIFHQVSLQRQNVWYTKRVSKYENYFERHISTRQANYASLSKSMRGKEEKKKARQNHQYKLAACCHPSLWKRASLLLMLKFKTAHKLCPDNKGQFENVQTWYNECPNKKKNRKQPDCKTWQPCVGPAWPNTGRLCLTSSVRINRAPVMSLRWGRNPLPGMAPHNQIHGAALSLWLWEFWIHPPRFSLNSLYFCIHTYFILWAQRLRC